MKINFERKFFQHIALSKMISYIISSGIGKKERSLEIFYAILTIGLIMNHNFPNSISKTSFTDN